MSDLLARQVRRAEVCCEENAQRIEELTEQSSQVSSTTVHFQRDIEWLRFEEFIVNGTGGGAPPDNNLVLTTDVGTGSVTATGGVVVDDLRFLLLDNLDLHNAQVTVSYSLNENVVSFGIALRVTDTEAVVVWNESTQSSNLQGGTWEYSGNVITFVNPGPNEQPLVDQRILKAEGDGATVTITTPTPHFLDPDGEEVRLVFGPFDGTTVSTATPVTSDSFTITSTEAGSWTMSDGTWNQDDVEPVIGRERLMGVRLVDDRLIFKHWRRGEPEPDWADPLRSTDNVIADSGSGRVGLVVGFLDDGNSFTVGGDLTVTPINGVTVT